MARSMSVTYGSYTVNEANNRLIVRPYREDVTLQKGNLEFEFIIASTSGVAIETEIAAAEAAFRRHNADFTLTQDGNTIVDWSPSTGTASLVETTLRKIGDPTADTNQSRRYLVSVRADLPADTLDVDDTERAGRRPYKYDVSYDEDQRRTVTIVGEYTSIQIDDGMGGTTVKGSRANYDDSIDTLAAAVTSAVDGSARWDLASEDVETDEDNGVSSYRISYVEATTGATVTYNGVTVGSSTYPIVGDLTMRRDYESIFVQCEVELTSSTASALATAAATLEEAYRVPRQNLTVAFGGTNVFEGTQSAGTIIDADPDIQRSGDPSKAGYRSRRYTITIRAGLPADNLSLAGRRSSTITVGYDASRRRTLAITGEYTATSNDSTAEAAYLDAISAYSSSVLTSAGGTWELIDEQRDKFETDKVLSFTRTYRELIYSEQADANVVEQQVSITVVRPGTRDSSPPNPGSEARRIGGGTSAAVGEDDNLENSGIVNRLALITATISCNVDNEQVSTVAAFDTLAENLVNYLLLRVDEVVPDRAGIALMDRTIQRDRDGWMVVCSIQLEAAIFGGWLQYRRTSSTQVEYGTQVIPAWGGDPLSAFVYQGLGRAEATVTEEGLYLGSAPDSGIPPAPPVPGRLRSVLMSRNRNVTRVIMGSLESEMNVYEVGGAYRYMYYVPIG